MTRGGPHPRGAGHQRATPYVDALRAYARLGGARLNVPGHKGRAQATDALGELLGDAVRLHDVPPLIPGIDAGPSPTPREQAEALAAEAWGAARTWFLTNGASQGNVAALLALAAPQASVVVPRNVHSSVIDGLVLSGLKPRFVRPEVDEALGMAHGMTPGALAAALDDTPDAAGVLLVSPSYYGAAADVAGLVAVAHERGVPVVVDESWGAHLCFHPPLPPSALASGADVVVSSSHKLAGSLTQSAMLHAGHGPLAARLAERLPRALAATTSTSASSLLLASLDAARQWMELHGERALDETLRTAAQLRAALEATGRFDVADAAILRSPAVAALDPLRVVIDLRRSGWSGLSLGDALRRRAAIDFELVTDAAVVAVLGPDERFEDASAALVAALERLPEPRERERWRPGPAPAPVGEPEMLLRTAVLSPSELVRAEQAVGRLSAEALAAYPPGIPNLLPGERITAEVVEVLRSVASRGGYVRGATDPSLAWWQVIA